MIVALAATGDWLSYALGAGALVGGIGYAAGQFVSSRRRALGDSLDTAIAEVHAYKGKTDRLEFEIAEMQEKIHRLEEENIILKNAIATGDHLAPRIAEAISQQAEAAVRKLMSDIQDVANREHAKTRALIKEINK